MQPVTAAKVKFGIWGLICGAIIAMIVGFVWGGWTTSSTTTEMSDEAVLATQAAICVAQFVKAPSHDEKLKEFQAENHWRRPEFIGKGGWDKMPGEKKASDGVARACVEGIELLIKQ